MTAASSVAMFCMTASTNEGVRTGRDTGTTALTTARIKGLSEGKRTIGLLEYPGSEPL